MKFHVLPRFSLLSVSALLTLSGCLTAESLYGVSGGATSDGLPDFDGCVSAIALDTSRIKVGFAFPASATLMTLYRNGNQISQFDNPASITFEDGDLDEGVTYRYTCKATFAGDKTKVGSKAIDASTLSINAPAFEGVFTTAAVSSRSVKVSWKAGGGKGSVKIANYKIWATVGATVNFAADPIKTVASGSSTVTISSLGDELKYSFGVRACSTEDVCDTNSVGQAVTLVDGGPPQTVGVTAISTQGTTATVTAPYLSSMGAIKYRQVYRKTSNDINFTTDTPVKSVTIANPLDPSTYPTAITVPGLAESTTYYFAIKDIDPAGNATSVGTAFAFTTGDLTPPAFTDVPVLTAGTPADTAVNLSFIAIDNQGVNPAGAWQYSIYRTSIPEAAIPADPCSPSGQLVKTIPAAGYTSGQTVSTSFSGLVSRTNYAFCVKASDQIGNLSDNSSYGTIKTRDITPPTFDGVSAIAYDNGLSKLNVTYPWSSSADIKEYKIRVWRVPSGGQNTSPCGNTTTNCGSVTSFTQVHPATISGVTQTFSFSTTDFVFAGGDRLYASVDACDNASPTFGAQNCTAFPAASALSLIVPDTTPPAAFAGITAFNPATDRPSEGTVTVHWAAPPSWSDYRGFKVYTVDTTHGNALSEVKDCACSGADCPDMITSCSISGLLPYKTYYFHVRAYDAGGNLTTYLDPASSRFSIQTTDTTPPTFSSGVSAAYSGGAGGIVVTWNAGTDTQADSSTLTYTLYRKDISTFATPTSPSTGGTLKVSKTAAPLTYTDTTSLVEGQTLYYSLCVKDQSNNTKCDGTIAQVTVPDLTPPTISGVSVPGRVGLLPLSSTASHTMTWAISDNVTPASGLSVQVQRAVSSSPTMTFAASDTVVAQGYNLTTLTENVPVLGVTSGQYIHYLITVTDSATNSSTYQTKVLVRSCPLNYVYISSNPDYGNGGFCLSKFLMSAENGSGAWQNAGSGSASYTASDVPVSKPGGLPWVNIGVTDMVSECSSLGAGYRLTTTADFIVAAREAESQAANWSGGAVGTGSMPRGHTDNSPANTLVGPAVDTDGYVGTGNNAGQAQGSGGEERRNFLTANGETIWDLSGNVYVYVSDGATVSTSDTYPSLLGGVGSRVYNDDTARMPLGSLNRLIFGTAGAYGMATWVGTNVSPGTAGFTSSYWRSSCYADGSNAGVFQTNPGGGAPAVYSGFRCVYDNAVATPVAPIIASPLEGASTKAVSMLYRGTCDSRPGVTLSVTGGTGTTIVYSSCVANQLTVWARHTPGAANRSITVTSTLGGATATLTRTVANAAATCPTNYVLVPGRYMVPGQLSEIPTPDFCVAQYEMKAAVSAGGALASGGTGTNPYAAAEVADSRPDGLPWVNLTQPNAVAECSALGTGYALISNAQWNNMARDIENYAPNWSSGTRGTGMIARGHTDNTPATLLDITDTSDPYIGTGNNSGQAVGSGWEQKRTHLIDLGSGATSKIWDVGGNAQEWVSDSSLGAAGYSGTTLDTGGTYQNILNPTYFPSTDQRNKANFAPLGPYDNNYGMGAIYGGNTSAGTYFVRGGAINSNGYGGPFSLIMWFYTSASTYNLYGFRCVAPLQ